MAIKIECAECGHDNDLGRVFCTQCGQKLDMSRTSMPELQDRREFDVRKFVAQLVGWTVFLAVTAVLGLSLWPAPRPAGERSESGAAGVLAKAKTVKRAATNKQSMVVTFTEAELNGYLALRAKARKVDVLTIDLRPGAFELQAWQKWTPPFTNVAALARISIPISRGLTGAFEGGKLVVKRGAMGHLPLAGLVAGMTESFFALVLDDLANDDEVAAAVTGVTIEDDRATVKLGR
jgi:hypothetical protein